MGLGYTSKPPCKEDSRSKSPKVEFEEKFEDKDGEG